uniref:DNA-directed RNA polymerase subunit alpha n=1 Tax=Pseudopedinella elastica TaxID=35684 RepID=A0A516ZAH2_9STRA|nr:RNA polymerase alpha subunit [Pseudopedinella elastica]QDR24712.1 RNA polymerase alpha subunit [Pseudopedinella elastica]
MTNLTPGQGLTLGNALRRVLLANLEGNAITAIRIPNASHEFSLIPGIREDILEILLNLKQIILKTKYTDKISGKIIAKGPGIITANCLKFDNEVEIINPNQYIAAISTAQNIEFDIIAERGVGYQLADQTEQKAKDFLQIDAVFMPVVKVNYKINNIYVSHNKTNESLLLEITTNGSITPEKAVSEAAKKLMIWFSSLTNEENLKPEQIDIQQTIPQPEVILIEELQLPVRAYNCLKRAGINSVDELIQYSQEEIKEIKNFGKKSADEVFQALKKKFNIILPSLKS